MDPATTTDLEMGVITDQKPLTSNPVEQYLELVVAGDVPAFQAEIVHYPLNVTAGNDVFDDRTPLHMAALHGRVEIAKLIVTAPGISEEVVQARDRFGYTPLHLAVRSEHVDVVRLLVTLTTRIVAATSERDERGEDCDGFTPLHVAATVGNLGIVRLLLACGDPAAYIRVTNWQGMTALDIAKRRNQKKLVVLLECCDVNWLELERQKSANSVNAILVGAALVATVTFASFLQPPLGIPTQDSSSSSGPAPAPVQLGENSPSYVLDKKAKMDQVVIGWFFIVTACSFGCSVVSLVIGITATIPYTGLSLKGEVQQLRKSVVKASVFLFLAIFFLVLAMALGSWLVDMVDELMVNIVHRNNYGANIVAFVILPSVILAFVLRYILVPKGRYKLKKWMLAFLFLVALGIGFAILLLDTFEIKYS